MGVRERIGGIEKINDGVMESDRGNKIDVRCELLEQNRRLGSTALANGTRIFCNLRAHEVGIGNILDETFKLVT